MSIEAEIAADEPSTIPLPVLTISNPESDNTTLLLSPTTLALGNFTITGDPSTNVKQGKATLKALKNLQINATAAASCGTLGVSRAHLSYARWTARRTTVVYRNVKNSYRNV
ncbi:hypothetical protein CB0940_03213 [Cercospora beticola]|uniref:Uncharacterized protein n=1 Tax=Cercospora beticola TaxID=122368 RepID=A0A2G5I2X3_CERBT|nr:hypothetical protein CB0940_03213 [Cercospora beticola]PIA98843.1 hypothetical protein CB0940_03213 [Cercospora beticola]WPB00386.1 hypothetical protein RHO25_005005 [Cercospora beticola]CAK1361407.1 unnamed protein product [Cercospora beticola]